MLDLLIKNALLLDLESGKESLSCVGIERGRISLTAPYAAGPDASLPDARKVVDVNGQYLFPGFVDFHTHLFRHGSQFGMDADLLVESGITAAADMGSAGWVNFPAMYKCDLAGKKIRLTSYLHISPVGQPGRGVSEPLNDTAISEEGIEKILREYPGAVTGLKVRLSTHIVKELGTQPLRRAVELGERFGLPVCVHTTDPPDTPDRIAAMLRPGDIYSHTYQGKGHTASESKEILEGMLAAKARGVLIEVGNGSLNFNFPVAERCLEAGLTPDIISSDSTPMTFHNNPAMWDLSRVVSKFLNLGISLPDAIRAVTLTPAKVLGMENVISKIAPGYEADLAVFRVDMDPLVFSDSAGNERTGPRGLVPVMTICRGQIVWEG